MSIKLIFIILCITCSLSKYQLVSARVTSNNFGVGSKGVYYLSRARAEGE